MALIATGMIATTMHSSVALPLLLRLFLFLFLLLLLLLRLLRHLLPLSLISHRREFAFVFDRERRFHWFTCRARDVVR